MKDTGPFDCLLIPGAEKAADAAMVVDCNAGGKGGIVSASGTISITVCSKLMLVTSERQQAFHALFSHLSIQCPPKIQFPLLLFHQIS